jgi:mannose-6-phosphate isomerase-like protein (cupin superfamily)
MKIPPIINIEKELNMFTEYFQPRIIGELNNQEVKLVKMKGPFTWHFHETADEMFMVLAGTMQMEFREKIVDIHPNEIIIIPQGMEHRPNSLGEVHLLLFEPKKTLNTGNIQNEFTFQATPN